MDIQKWIETYSSNAYIYKVKDFSEVEARQIIDDFKQALSNRKIIFYGAGTVGRVFYQLLKELDIAVEFVVDKNARSIVFFEGVPVYPPEYLREHMDEGVQLIVTINHSLYQEVLDELNELGVCTEHAVCGHEIHMVAQAAWCMMKAYGRGDIVLKNCYECTNLDNTCTSLNRYLRRKNGFRDSGQGTRSVRMMGYALSNVCSLRCKNCCELVPYMPASIKKLTPTENVIKDIKHLSAACNFLTLLEFVGGEPFLHPGLPDILTAALEIKNIGVIHIFTNGTVVPSDELCNRLKNDRITVYLSNYQVTLPPEKLQMVAQTEKKLKEHEVNYFFGKKQNWSDFSDFELVNTDKELEEVFEACFLHNCNRLQDGRLFVCAHQYAGVMLGELQENNEMLHIHDYSSEQLAKELDRLKVLKTIDACRYCRMPFKAETVLSGEQLI